jgi:16S rRNA processing protein RimM
VKLLRKRYLECGKIVSTHGVRGELKVLPWCDTPEYLCGFGTLYLDAEGKAACRVLGARPHKGAVLLLLEGVSSIDEAVPLRGKTLFLDRGDAPEDGRLFLQDLIGLTVKDADSGQVYGKLHDVIETGANDVYDLRDENGRQRLIPAIPQVVLETDLDAGVMLIRPLEGLFDAD